VLRFANRGGGGDLAAVWLVDPLARVDVCFGASALGVAGLSDEVLLIGFVGIDGFMLAIVDLGSISDSSSGVVTTGLASGSIKSLFAVLSSPGDSDWITANVPRATNSPTARKRPMSGPLLRRTGGSCVSTSMFSFSVIVSSGRLDIQREDTNG